MRTLKSLCKRLAFRSNLLVSGLASALTPAPEAHECMSRLQEIGTEIAELNRSTDGEFLSIGEELQSFHQGANEISELSASVGSSLSAKEICDAMDGLASMVERAQRGQGEAKLNASTLERILDAFERIGKHLAGFGMIVRELRVLCVSIRIESARLGEGTWFFKLWPRTSAHWHWTSKPGAVSFSTELLTLTVESVQP
jgi:hypothetical protein